jgi:hypothetical protein
VFDYIVEAVHLVAARGARLLPDYRFDPRSGLWRHRRAGPPEVSLRQLRSRVEDPPARPGRDRAAPVPMPVPDSALDQHLRQAEAILAAPPRPNGDRGSVPVALPDGFDRLRWFELSPVCLGATLDEQPRP